MAVKTPKLKAAAKSTARKAKQAVEDVPSPSSNPATNLLIMDVAIRGLSLIAGRAIERAALRARYKPGKAADVVKGRTLIESMAAQGAARMATRSVPGFLLVTGGLVAKVVFDRSLGRREARRRGEKQLSEQAAKADE